MKKVKLRFAESSVDEVTQFIGENEFVTLLSYSKTERDGRGLFAEDKLFIYAVVAFPNEKELQAKYGLEKFFAPIK